MISVWDRNNLLVIFFLFASTLLNEERMNSHELLKFLKYMFEDR